ncbi:MAG: carboxyl transferase domain-containing protein [Myxococcales bacterium]|jgi:acetyl-CoA carboxylase carboxyltransferase component
MSWKEEVDGIAERRRLAARSGGEEAVQRHHERGKLTVRERIDGLLDAGSFQETAPMAGEPELRDGKLAGFTPANYVLGVGRVDGRPCAVGGEDFTIRGGSPSVGGLRKSVFAESLAVRYRVPLVRLHEGGGGSVAGPSKGQPRPPGPDNLNSPPRFMSVMQALATVPVVSAAMGPTAGMPAARLAASHFTLMVKDTSQVMIAGPALVERAMGTKLDKDALGGPRVHLKSGVVDNLAQDETDAFAQIRRFLSYLPSSVYQRAPRGACDDPVERAEQELLSIIPRERRKPYKMRRLIELVVDRGSFFELSPRFGPSQIIGLARVDGRPVGVLANDPMYYAGAMTAAAAEKLTRLVDLCDQFHLPVVSLVDQPGFMIGPESEASGTIRRGAAAICAVMQSRVPWISVIVRKTYGVAGAAHFGPGGVTLAWPSAETGALPLEGGVAVAFRREIEAADDPEARRRELEEALAARRDPYRGAESGSVYDLIDPRTTRRRLAEFLELSDPLLDEQLGPVQRGPRP